MDILKHMPIRTWLYIFLDDPKGYMEKLSTKCAKQMYDLKMFSDLSLGIKPNLDLESESYQGVRSDG